MPAIESPFDEVLEHLGIVAARVNDNYSASVVNCLRHSLIWLPEKFVIDLRVHRRPGLVREIVSQKDDFDTCIHHGMQSVIA